MREAYQTRLDGLADELADMCDSVGVAMRKATDALLHADLALAEDVISGDLRIDALRDRAQEDSFGLLALQAPVATDLRLIAALLHVLKNIERMGDQCVNICKVIPLTGHEPPADPEMVKLILTMGAHSRSLISQAKRAFEERNIEMAQDLVVRDDVVDELNRDCFRLALAIGDDTDKREWAMTMMLTARAIERIADNAVDIGEQVAFVVTGLFREFEDASHPHPDA